MGIDVKAFRLSYRSAFTANPQYGGAFPHQFDAEFKRRGSPWGSDFGGCVGETAKYISVFQGKKAKSR
jgi:hypothetical protein